MSTLLRNILILIFTLYPLQTIAQGKNMNPLENQPYFTLKINGFGAIYFAEVNGVSVYEEFDSSGQMTTSFPVNHLMRPDKNSIELFVLPSSQGDKINSITNIDIQLLVAPNNDRSNTTSIASIKFEGGTGNEDYVRKSSSSGNYSPDNNFTKNDSGSVIVEDIKSDPVKEFDGAIHFTRALTIPNTLPLWNFFSSDTLPRQSDLNMEEHNTLRDELFIEYNKIQTALSNKDVKGIIDLFSERNEELDAAFYYKPGTMKLKLETALTEAVNNPDLELSDLKPEYLTAYLSTGRKLVSLKRGGAQSAIGFDYKDPDGGSQRYDIIYRKENGKWIISR